jgi:hypothetical protein
MEPRRLQGDVDADPPDYPQLAHDANTLVAQARDMTEGHLTDGISHGRVPSLRYGLVLSARAV